MADTETLASSDVVNIPPVMPQATAEAGQQLPLSRAPNGSAETDEQALESHEVIELQTFSDRKVWIEEKIKFLESLPPIEVFIGLDELATSAEEVHGLPSRAQLEQWVVEHDAIEKETEIFDTGELKKLRKLTKAATQRNLSPEDTDVIELTLTTIYALDKLLHLLRDRSENLEMMNTRLSFEEYRGGAWKDRRILLEDLQKFAASRARWNPSIYEAALNSNDTIAVMRRGSVASVASAKSDNPITSPAFTRAARYRLGEQISKEAALLSARLSSMKHGKAELAGKALDRLIDQSRRGPVPDVFLDEMDRVEAMAEKEMETVSSFLMQLVMQWRRADELYVETLKDQTSASNLLEEIETAKMHHPTSRQSASFVTRIDTILKRLTIRGNPAAPGSIFPRPEHPHFPDQPPFNTKLVNDLAANITGALTTAQAAATAAQEYKESYEQVKQMETWLELVDKSLSELTAISTKIRDGPPSEDGEGCPPNLVVPACLDPSSHSLYMALFPSMVQDCKQSLVRADDQLQLAPSKLVQLHAPNISAEFKESANAKVQQLTLLRMDVARLLEESSAKVSRLRDSRKISASIDTKLAALKETKLQIVETMERSRWRQEFNGSNIPLTPESPAAEVFTPMPTEEQLSQIDGQINVDITVPLAALSPTLEAPLHVYLTQKVTALQNSLKDGHQLLELLGSIKHQTSSISSARDDFHSLLARIEDAKIHLTDMIDGAVHATSTASDANDHGLNDIGPQNLASLEKDAAAFIDGLSGRIPFVSRHASFLTPLHALKSPPLSASFETAFFTANQGVPLPFDLPSLDAGVRSDSNSYAMRINGGLRSLDDLKAHLELAEMAKSADSDLGSIFSEMESLTTEISSERKAFESIPRQKPESAAKLEESLGRLKKTLDRHVSIKRSLSPTRQFLRQMDEKSNSLEAGIRKQFYKSRVERLDEYESQLNRLGDDISTLLKDVTRGVDLERQHQEDLRLAEELRKREEEARAAAEVAEGLRLEEEERQAAEERRKLEAKQLEERRQALEQQHHSAYLAERQRLEEEAAAAEKQRLFELEQEAAAARAREAEERLQQEEAERSRIEKERLDALEQLRLAQAQLDEQRRLYAQRELATSESAKLHQLQLEELARKQAEILAQAEENSRRAEIERSAKELAEMQAKGHEEELLRQQSELQKLMEAGKMRAELDGAAQAKATKDAQQHAEALEQQRLDALQLAEQHARETEIARAKAERAEQEAKELAAELAKQKLALEEEMLKLSRQQVQAALQTLKEEPPLSEEPFAPQAANEQSDVFGIQAKPGHRRGQPSLDLTQIQAKILALRNRLRSICINEVLRPNTSSAQLPSEAHLTQMKQDFARVTAEIEKLPKSSEDANLNMELKALRDEAEALAVSLKNIDPLAALHGAIQACDAALSDLLEHIDSYPAAPLILSSKYTSMPSAPPEEQLSGRLSFTKGLVEDAASRHAVVSDDSRATSEYSRISQTWTELHEMAKDRISAPKSRPSSVVSKVSSGGDSRASVNPALPTAPGRSRKKASYSNLSVSSVHSKGNLLTPPVPSVSSRRSTSSQQPASRSASRVSSVSTNRSVSGPMNTSTLFGSTFASRQRTTSLSSNSTTMGPPASLPRKPSQPPSRLRVDSQTRRGVSPALSENPSSSRTSTWSRAPRDSMTAMLPRSMTPQKKMAPPVRKKYVADPKNKLDVAVGEVVNQLDVGINVEGITETWRDQSGKYWIGNQDPKLCFCRILRSQTVMVRVGGGWTELSRFIKDHFAESFRIAPESPPRPGSQAEKWISSATLLQARESTLSPPPHPRTPEPTMPFVPSFALVTPSGQSPKSMKSSPQSNNLGSPLTALQFIRRAEVSDHSQMRPTSPSARITTRARPSLPSAPSRPSVWRP